MKDEKKNVFAAPNHQAQSEQAGIDYAKEAVEIGVNKLDDYTSNLIDQPMTQFIDNMSKYNVGALRSIRVFFEDKERQVDAVCQELVQLSQKKKQISFEEIQKITAVHVVLSRIIDRMGAIDHIIIKNSIK